MADLNKPRKDHMVRIPIHGGPAANLGWFNHFPHPRHPEPPDSSWAPVPTAGIYRLLGDGPHNWRYVWQGREDFLAELAKKSERFR